MSLECSECERDCRGPHDESCSRYVKHLPGCESERDEEAECTCPPQPHSGAAQPAPETLWSFWYSKKHSDYYSRIFMNRSSVLIDGKRVEYTECCGLDALPVSSTRRGGKFDDYVFLGNANPNTIISNDLSFLRPAALAGETRTEARPAPDEKLIELAKKWLTENGYEQWKDGDWHANGYEIAQLEREKKSLQIQLDSAAEILREHTSRLLTAEAALTQARTENSVELFCSYVDDILTGKDTGNGVGVSPWEPTRRRLLKLRSQKSALMEAIEPFTHGRSNMRNGHTKFQRAARVYEQVKEKI